MVGMSRWPADAQGRLERAALELSAERGFAATTVPQIAERAGLTTRTFFRHFADKREVLFAYQAELPTVVVEVLAATPVCRNPIEQSPTDSAPSQPNSRVSANICSPDAPSSRPTTASANASCESSPSYPTPSCADFSHEASTSSPQPLPPASL